MRLFTLLAMLCSVSAFAEDVVPAQKAKYSEIERGFYASLRAGPWFLINAPASTGPRPFSAGPAFHFELGGDIGPYFSIGAFGAVAANRAGADFKGYGDGSVVGDFSTFNVGGAVKVSPIGFKDSQDVKRTWLYIRAGGAFVMYSPKTLFPNATSTDLGKFDALVFGGLGIEYFTRLRHFSIALDAQFNYYVLTGAMGFAVTPCVRYAF